MSSFIFQNIFWFSAITSSVCVFTFALTQNIREKRLKLIFFLLGISVICSAANILFNLVFNSPQPLVGIAYRLLEFGLLLNLYWLEFFKLSQRSSLLRVFLILLTSSTIIYFDPTAFRWMNAILFVFLSLGLYWLWIKRLPSTDIIKAPGFWINNGIFIYFSSSLLLFISEDYLRQNYYEEFAYIWSLSNFFAIIKNIFFLYAFRLYRDYRIRHAGI